MISSLKLTATAPEKGWLEDHVAAPFGGVVASWQVASLLVSGKCVFPDGIQPAVIHLACETSNILEFIPRSLQ